MNLQTQPRVQSKLLRVFVLQLALISFATIASVFAASLVAERILVTQALTAEADYFWQHKSVSADFPVPNTHNLQGYLTGDSSRDVPLALQGLQPGQQRVQINGDDAIAFVSERNGQQLTLLFQDETVSNLGFYFGVVPLTLVLLLMYALAYMTYLMTKKAVSPIARLADTIEKFDFNARDATELDLGNFSGPQNSETRVLANALQHFIERTKDSIERERNFARYASHELRTPLAVIQGSISSLELVHHDGAPARATERIKRTTRHMVDLINTLLLLAKDNADIQGRKPIAVNPLVEEIISELDEVLPDKSCRVSVHHNDTLVVNATDATLRIVIGNILRNACIYTENGTVDVTIDNACVMIADSGKGFTDTQRRRIFEPFFRLEGSNAAGHGLGLALVKNTCLNFDWDLQVESELNVGSRFTVGFGNSIA